ncbi:hypothetical protein XELAEV_18019282mg [Xenopus laevis]|uniref:Paraneoplastic antigen Ma-like C-terminal domain-containing protein n=1 Tax=Xenopus laevis TaxID=8355 RepID=A0A974HUF4_XENLA|nr:hypothetical protein XELAEV_18019282mg [Xenopus laevis]
MSGHWQLAMASCMEWVWAGRANEGLVPPDIDAESEGPWKIVLPDMSDDAELTTQGDALTSQNAVQAQESVLLNKTLFDSPAEKSQIKRCPSCERGVSKGSWHSSGGRLDTSEIVSGQGQLTDQLTQLAWNGNFKRLKVFSGTDPEPTGGESFESWRDSTVVSSLHSPAVDVVKSYMVGHPDSTSGDLIEVLEVTFGPVESATEMLYRFHSTFQKEKEDLSVYLVRPEQGLRLLVIRGAVTDDEMDSLRIHQPKRGTLHNDPVAVTISAHYQDKLPPGYVALMERVWQEETDAYVRVKRSSTSGHTEKSLADAKLLEENNKELEDLKAQLSERAKPPPEAKKVPKCYRCGNLHCVKYAAGVEDSMEDVTKVCESDSICESDSPEEDKVLSRDKTTVENLVGMKACQGIRQARTLPVCPREECRGHEESFPSLSACDIIQPSCMLDSDPIGWEL